MRSSRVPRAALLVLVTCSFAQGTWAARELTFEERVAAQEAFERVYYAHQIGATRSFDEAVPGEALEKKVRKYLAQSVALERLWHTPVTAEMLQSELQRMATRTRMPARLRELFAALDDDAFLIQECLVRPILVDRLARHFFAFDARIHVEAWRDAEKIHDDLASGRLEPATEHAARNVVVLQRQEGARPLPRRTPDRSDGVIELEPEEFDRWRGLVPPRTGVPGAVSNEREAYTIRVVLEEHADRVVIATYGFPKRTWDDWWLEAETGLDGAIVEVVASESLPLPQVASSDGRACEGDSWDNGILDASPDRRSRHSAVWTGSQMIVWSGYTFGGYSTRTGFRYEPATDSWTATSTAGAPAARGGHSTVWTGRGMVVWGGIAQFRGSGNRYSDDTNTGGRYDPATNSWTSMTTVGAPEARTPHTAVWAGSKMIIWGAASSTSCRRAVATIRPQTRGTRHRSTMRRPSVKPTRPSGPATG